MSEQAYVPDTTFCVHLSAEPVAGQGTYGCVGHVRYTLTEGYYDDGCDGHFEIADIWVGEGQRTVCPCCQQPLHSWCEVRWAPDSATCTRDERAVCR